MAAHLYAIGMKILVHHKNPQMAKVSELAPLLRPAKTLDDLLSQLESLPGSLDIDTLFQVIHGALSRIEKEFCDTARDSKALRGKKRIGKLGCTVHFGLRLQPALGVARKRRYELKPGKRPPAPTFYLNDPSWRLTFYQEDGLLPAVHWVNPGRHPKPLFRESGRDASERKHFRIALCPLRGPFHPQFQIHPEKGDSFRAVPQAGIYGADRLHRRLAEICSAAARQEVHLLVFPELTVDPHSRRFLSRLLRESGSRFPYAVIAGSFHVWPQEASTDWPGVRPCNESVILDQRGAELLAPPQAGAVPDPR